MLLKHRLTRIVATLGPASDDSRTISRLIHAGMDVARLNMSHGDHDSHRRLARKVRQEARRAGRTIGVMVDLQGPRSASADSPIPPDSGGGNRWS